MAGVGQAATTIHRHGTPEEFLHIAMRESLQATRIIQEHHPEPCGYLRFTNEIQAAGPLTCFWFTVILKHFY